MAKKEQTTSLPLPEGTQMVKVRVPRVPGHKRPCIYVSVNDYTYAIKFNEWVEVPDFIAKVLEERQERMEYADAYTAALEQQE